ncbi:MAG: YdcH family protein [Paracoccaceae bacterium]
MPHVPNDLEEIFPHRSDEIARLRTSDAEFARLADDYDKLNHAIHRAETNLQPTDDVHLENMRKRRLLILDTISPYLRKKTPA